MSNEKILELYNKRQLWVESTKENGFDEGINNLLTELYPDNAHFIYELLQNAEDAQATEVNFELKSDKLQFTHNGRFFNDKDLDGITSIGQGTKASDINKIGKFGVGFKAVFSYTSTPYIYSGSYNFKIENLVVPTEVKQEVNTDKTIMIFPFNYKEKPKNIAFDEIKKGLSSINDNSLLFLTNIKTINYSYKNTNNKIVRTEIDDIKVNISNKTTNKNSSWLRFKKYLPGSNVLFVSVAFKLENDEKLKKEIIIPVEGEVSIYFPAEKETSNLKFHIHAPFASTVARDSIKEREENNDLRDIIADLLCESLDYVKGNNLLNFNFLQCLPIDDDNLAEFYLPLQKKLIDNFNNCSYNIIDRNGYKPATQCYRSSAEIKRLVNIDFLKLLLDIEDKAYWSKNAPQKNSREDKFLNSLNIKEFGNEEFIENLEYFTVLICEYDLPAILEAKLGAKFVAINSKSDKWFGQLYSYLYKQNQDDFFFNSKQIIRLSNNILNIDGDDCYFSDNKSGEYKIVKKEIYTSNSKSINEKAKLFLESLGVKEIGKKEKVELVLKNRYSKSKKLDMPIKEHLNDIKLFLNYFGETRDISIFRNKSIFLDESDYLQQVNNLIIDKPYFDTKMKFLMKKGYFKDAYLKYIISDEYKKIDNQDLLIDFLKKLNITHELLITNGSMEENNNKINLKQDCNKTKEMSATKTEQDWVIRWIITLQEYKNFEISLLIWNTMIKADQKVLTAKYRPNKSCPTRETDSVLVQRLKEHPWIPNKNGKFYLAQDMSRDMLPEEFIYDDRNGWLTAIDFGENIRKNQKEYQETNKIIKEKTGFGLDILEKANEAGITEDKFKEFIKQQKKQKTKESLLKNQSNGDSQEFIQAKNDEEMIIDDKKHTQNIANENKKNSNKFTTKNTNYQSQDNSERKKIEDFLYKEYEGHCQICGDTFAYNNKNYFEIKSLNIGKNRNVSKKGNTLSLCCKHHKVLYLKLQKNEFIKNLDDIIDLKSIEDEFIFEDFVSRDDINDNNDAFYILNENDDFVRDVYFLPIKLFNNEEYIKFTKAHIMEFIEVWNNN